MATAAHHACWPQLLSNLPNSNSIGLCSLTADNGTILHDDISCPACVLASLMHTSARATVLVAFCVALLLAVLQAYCLLIWI